MLQQRTVYFHGGPADGRAHRLELDPGLPGDFHVHTPGPDSFKKPAVEPDPAEVPFVMYRAVYELRWWRDEICAFFRQTLT